MIAHSVLLKKTTRDIIVSGPHQEGIRLIGRREKFSHIHEFKFTSFPSLS